MEKGKYSVDWAGHIAAAHSELVEQENTRELGKIRQALEYSDTRR